MWKRKFVRLILLASCLGMFWPAPVLVKADVQTSTYDITIVSGGNAGGGAATTQDTTKPTLPKTGLKRAAAGILPQLNDQQMLGLLIGGLFLIGLLLALLLRQIWQRRQQS